MIDDLIHLLDGQHELTFTRSLDKDGLPYFDITLTNPSVRICGCRSISQVLRMAMKEFKKNGTK